MIITFVIPPSLKKVIRNKIKLSEYSVEELSQLYNRVKLENSNNKKGYKRLVYCTLLISFLLTILSIEKLFSNSAVFNSIVLVYFVLALLLVIIKHLYVDRVKRQFLKAIEQGYPNMAESFTFK